ncbi:uncharacterized protein LOC125947185 [Dermacentor silvarum]|uniref:uncharacterized protein LOC125947185 n=1 Tax=Dermacentor silvarum TaxID=543639 RepID=UPI0021017B6C|nr:uncharacterized protein LOC125947185 [Dermacentor silvarum]
MTRCSTHSEPWYSTEQREAADTAIKRSLIAGSLMVLFLAGLFSYIVLSTLWSQSRPGPVTEKEDDSTPPAHYDSYQLSQPTRSSNSPPTDVSSPNKDSSESTERTEHSSTDESSKASTEKEVTVLNH